MKKNYNKFLNDDLWVIKENEWVESLQNIRESQFALGNGYIGTRGVLEELPSGCMPGTYIAGIYDKVMSRVANLVNLPNPFNFMLAVGGEKVDCMAMDIVSHRRVLNMLRGVLVRSTEFKNVKGERFAYHSLRFVSMDNKNIGAMQIVFIPMDADCVLEVRTGIDTSITNVGMSTEGKKNHFRIKDLGQEKNIRYCTVETLERKHSVVYLDGYYYSVNGKKNYPNDNVLELSAKRGRPVVFTKIFYIENFPVGQEKTLKGKIIKKFRRIFRTDFKDLTDFHIAKWKKLWEICDVQVKGTSNLQQNLRFNIYHLLISGNIDNGFSSIGARTLSGEGYKGHIFWDAEIFIMPFFLFTNPEVAKNMLVYRYRRLDKAREIASAHGYRGAMFPWESAGEGDEQTPSWARDINGKVVKIFTHKMEQFITAVIAYAVYKYYMATEDDGFMRECGYEMLFEIARFWTSRVEYSKTRKKCEIRGVIGPDEFHINVNNNAFTNFMVKWCLITAHRLYGDLKRRFPEDFRNHKNRLGLKDKEISEWFAVAAKIKSPKMNRNNVIEQFDGYFKLLNMPVSHTDENGIPVLPAKLGTSDLGKTQLIKQPDVLMMISLFSDVFMRKTKQANYSYYMPRTVHKSSLSPSISSIAACDSGDVFNAYHLFNVSLRADISNLFGNTGEGIHAASIGGTWQAIVFGFAGVQIRRETICITPRIPKTWSKIIFTFIWKGSRLKFEITNNIVKIFVDSSGKKEVKICVFNKMQKLKREKQYVFKREKRQPYGFYY